MSNEKTNPENNSPAISQEIPTEKKALIEPWIEQFDAFDLTDAERISILFGMGLACCVKAELDFNALLAATIINEKEKENSDPLLPDDS